MSRPTSAAQSAVAGAKRPRAAYDGSMSTSLDDALEALAKFDERKSKVVELRFFGGLSVEETAEFLHVSPQTVMRDWKIARAWLTREMRRP